MLTLTHMAIHSNNEAEWEQAKCPYNWLIKETDIGHRWASKAR